ncbi:MAG: lysine--tRNA ligase [Epsilonproteobacteria bacterium]|nr:MAG: lysine--tRNA ligase [Campylobacterota bacterium]RLA64393.1 MAG: lysine--tRNA ligase [Campylobacterota bacterium]
MSENFKPIHWADQTADRIIRGKGDKEVYTLASGITPSGVVHFGNFRETMTVDLVARALKARGKNVRFIFSWDDYDTFRKIPRNMPNPEELEKYLFQPIVDTPDPFNKSESYAAHHEANYEGQLHRVDVNPESIYQAKKYRAGDYKNEIKKTLASRDKIAKILNQHRKEDLSNSWWPVSIYCEKCNRDKTSVLNYDGNNELSYVCDLCSHKGKLDLDNTSRVKLPWRLDWPMRWVFEDVDFEPGGKDHSSEGGSYTTAKEIVKDIYGGEAPLYLQYEFVKIKGGAGKMSSSSGEVVTLNDVLNVYEPEIVRWIFASYRTNVEFAVSFDLDVLKAYEDFDRQERLAFGVDSGNQKKVDMAKRVYQLSTVGELPDEMPIQPSFRHLCNLLQINEGNVEKTRSAYEIKNDRDERRFKERSHCALYWLKNYAPDDFKFHVNEKAPAIELNDFQKSFFRNLKSFLENGIDNISTDKELHEKMYDFINEIRESKPDFKPGEVFLPLYQILISKEKGPKLAGFIMSIGKEKILALLNQLDI